MTEIWDHISDTNIVHVISYLVIVVKYFAFLREGQGKESGRAYILGYRKLVVIFSIKTSHKLAINHNFRKCQVRDITSIGFFTNTFSHRNIFKYLLF